MSVRKFLAVTFIIACAFRLLPAEDRGLAQWVKLWGSLGNDSGGGVTTDGSGNIFVAGSAGGNIFLSKYDSLGADVWTRQAGSANSDYAGGVAADNSGNIYVTGWTFGDFDGNVNVGQSDVFLIKYDSSGEKKWSVEFGTAAFDYACGVAADTSGNVYVAGWTLGGIDGNTSAGLADIFITKYDSDGVKQWTKQSGTSNFDWCYGITADNLGNIYLVGATQGMLDGQDNTGYSDVFVIKYDSSGIKQWTKLWGSTSDDQGLGITSGSSGSIFVTGWTLGSFDGNINAGSTDIILTKLNSSGDRQWTRQLGTPENDCGNAVSIDNSGNIYVTGYTYGGFDGNTNAGACDVFITKFDSTGAKQWTSQLGTAFQDFGCSVAADIAGNIYLSGDSYGDLDGIVNTGANDVFLASFRSVPVNFFRIGGYVRCPQGRALSGVTVSLSGASTGTCITDLSGYYEFTNLRDIEDYTVTPHKKNHIFEPPTLSFDSLDNNKDNQNFTGRPAFYVVHTLAGRFNSPRGIAVDASRNVFVSDTGDSCIKKISSATVSAIIFDSEVSCPEGLALNSAGHLYIADTGNKRVRKKDAYSLTTIFGGGGELNDPAAIAVDASNNIYMLDRGNNSVIKMDISAATSTVSVELNSPGAIAADSAGSLYITDTGNNCVKKVDTSGIVTTIAGIGTAGYSGDDESAALAQLNNPEGVAVDSAGNVFVADTGNQCIRKIDPLGIITTIVKDDTAGLPLLQHPGALALDSAGALYVADTDTVKMCVLNYQPVLAFAADSISGVSPEAGNTATMFAFRAKYIDEDNDAPLNAEIKVHIRKGGNEISSSPFSMSETDTNDVNYVDGKIYEHSLKLPLGNNYTYSFEAHDANWIKAADISGGGPEVKSALRLLFPFASGGVYPEIGKSTNTYTFCVKYLHSDNTLPPAGFPKLYLRQSGADISGSPFLMQEEDACDTDCTDGKCYKYCLPLNMGTDYEYVFESFEVNDSTTIALLGIGPMVSPAVYNRDRVVLSNSVFRMNLNAQFTFELQLKDDSSVEIKVVSPSGEVIKSLADGTMTAGCNTIVWDGRNESGEKAGSGVYFIQTKTNTMQDIKKMAVIK